MNDPLETGPKPPGPAHAWSEGSENGALFWSGREFLAMLSHDLRSPLHRLLGFLDLAADGARDAEQRRCLHTARLCGEDLLGTLTGILEGVHADSGALVLHSRWHDLRSVIAAIAKGFRPQAEMHGIAFAWEIEADVAARWWFDRRKLEQILGNLLTNALKFTPEGGVRLRVSEISLETGRGLEFRVQDTGPGIPTERREQLFRPFEKGSPAAPSRLPGHGLGLWIVHRLTTALDGTVTIRSPDRRGTEVTLQFSWPHAFPRVRG